MIKAGIVGGTGYTGVELLRLLAQHPNVELAAITSRKEAGMPVADMFPSLRGRVSLAFSTPEDAPLKSCDVVFFATPNGVAMRQTRELLDAGVKVIDLAADFRIQDIAEWSRWYGMEHACPDLVAEAVYGLPEINRDKIASNRPELLHSPDNPGPLTVPENEPHIRNWIERIKDRGRCHADIEYGQRSSTLCYLVNIARQIGRVGQPLKWDPAEERFTNCDEGNLLLARERRAGYELPS